MSQTKKIDVVLVQALKQLGFQVHLGGEQDDEELRGRWWWTLTQDGWSGIEVAKGNFSTEEDAWADAEQHSLEDEDLQRLRILPVPTKWRLGTENSPIGVECDQTSLFGVATITSVGSENLYVQKNGVHYYSKVGCTERFAEGAWDFAKLPMGSDDAVTSDMRGDAGE